MSEKDLVKQVYAAIYFGVPSMDIAAEIMHELQLLHSGNSEHPVIAAVEKESYNRGYAAAEDKFFAMIEDIREKHQAEMEAIIDDTGL